MNELVLQIFKTNKKSRDKCVDFMNVWGQVFENIIRNPTEEKYRTLKKENKKMKETILSYKQSTSLLNLCGFIDKETFYSNSMSVSDNGLIKADLDIAFRNSLKIVFDS